MKIGNPIMLRRKFAKSSSSSSSSSNASKQTIPYELPRSNTTTSSSISNSSIRQSRIELFKPITMIITLIFLCCCIVILYFNITLDEKNEMSINILSFTSSSSSLLKTTTEDMKKVLVHNMEQKLQSLPSPLWPQLDHRTAEAIVSGTMVGFQNITEFNFNHTLGKDYIEYIIVYYDSVIHRESKHL